MKKNSAKGKKSNILDRVIPFFLALIMFIVISIVSICVASKSSWSDIFTSGRISDLENRPKQFEKDIVVNVEYLKDSGGIWMLTSNVLEGIAKKRPNWRLILIVDDRLAHYYKKSLPTVKFIYTRMNYTEIMNYIVKFVNFVTGDRYRNKIMQLCFYDKIFLDSKCDLLWDPVGDETINNFDIPCVTTVHDMAFFDLYKDYVEQGHVNWGRKRISASVKFSDKVITVSNFTKRRIVEKLGAPWDKVTAIPIQLGTRILSSVDKNEAKSILEKFKLQDKKYLIFISGFWPNKNHERLIRAFAQFIEQEKSSDLKLVLCGSKASKKIFKLVEQLGMKDRIIITGFVKNKDLGVLLQHSLAFVHSSVYEGFGMPVIEAMAAGIPVVCSDGGSLPEVAGDAALMINPYEINSIASAMSRIVYDSELRERLIKLGKKRAKKFEDTDSMVDEYIRVFEEVMSSKKKN